jgi:4-amino-4-deoxy-L-arabinose transferase-like glycosyltransferase
LGAPGALAALAIFADERGPLERMLLAVAGALGVAATLVLALHAIPGPLETWQLLVAADGLSLLGLFAVSLTAPLPQGERGAGGVRAEDRWLIPALLIAAGLRLPLLGAAELQGDEAYVLMLARGIRYGQPDILFVHMKGPVEALLPAGPLVITGVVTEWVARLPFAIAGLAVILGVWALAGRLIGGRAGGVTGLVAACALAIDGFLIAFSRIVQYQSVIMLLSVAAVWLCWRFYEGAERPRRYLLGAAFCIGVATLAHYDGALSTPALAWLVIAGGRRRCWSARQWATELAGPVALGLMLTLSFYVPFVLHEHFARTLGHLETRSGQGTAGPALFNSLIGYAELAGFYSFPVAFVSAGLALLGGLASWLAIYLRPRPFGWFMAALLAASGLAAALIPEVFSTGADHSLAVLGIAPPIIALALAPHLPACMRALVIWFGVPFIVMAFFFADPRTHFYTMHLPAALLAGLAVAQLYDALRRIPWLRAALAAGGAALLLSALPYAYLIFLRQRPEYQRRYPDTQAAIYRPLTGDTLGDDGYFGFPQQDGWKAVASLFQRGDLRGTVDSNQELFTTGWYLRGQFMCAVKPDYYVVSENTRPYYIPPGYQEYGEVTVSGERTLTIFSRAPVSGPPRSLDAATYEDAYDQTPVPDFSLRRLLSGVVPQRPSDAVWRAGFGLRGYDLDRSQLGSGDVAFLTLYWRAARPQPAGYRPVIQIRDSSGAVVAEAASICGGMPSDAWATTYVSDAPFIIRADDLPPGAYRLAVAVRGAAEDLLPLDDGATARDLGMIIVGR